MGGAMQHRWQHALPKTARPLTEFDGARINLTYRWIAP
jgi:alkylated DNA repair dioxygenase AlkB